jgi:hypothetical protein
LLNKRMLRDFNDLMLEDEQLERFPVNASMSSRSPSYFNRFTTETDMPLWITDTNAVSTPRTRCSESTFDKTCSGSHGDKNFVSYSVFCGISLLRAISTSCLRCMAYLCGFRVCRGYNKFSLRSIIERTPESTGEFEGSRV